LIDNVCFPSLSGIRHLFAIDEYDVSCGVILRIDYRLIEVTGWCNNVELTVTAL
jgi:hypothetical protein